MNSNRKILIALLPHLFGGTCRRTWERHAAKGLLGPVHLEPGKRRYAAVEREEVEKRFGAISEDRFAKALASYEAERRLVRRITL